MEMNHLLRPEQFSGDPDPNVTLMLTFAFWMTIYIIIFHHLFVEKKGQPNKYIIDMCQLL